MSLTGIKQIQDAQRQIRLAGSSGASEGSGVERIKNMQNEIKSKRSLYSDVDGKSYQEVLDYAEQIKPVEIKSSKTISSSSYSDANKLDSDVDVDVIETPYFTGMQDIQNVQKQIKYDRLFDYAKTIKYSQNADYKEKAAEGAEISKNTDVGFGQNIFDSDNKLIRAVNDKDFLYSIPFSDKLSDDQLNKGHEFYRKLLSDKLVGTYYMSDNERNDFNYILATEGKDAAVSFYKDLQEELNARRAYDIYDNMSTASKYLAAADIGVKQFEDSFADAFNFSSEASPVTSNEYLGAYIRQDDDINQFAFDVLNTTGNMVPSIIFSAVGGPTVGTVSMGISSGGRAKNEALREGKPQLEANILGASIGTIEACLEKALSGISAFGSKGISRFLPFKISGIKNAFARVAAQYGERMLSEGIEEGLQEMLEPVVKSLILKDEFEPASFEDVAYSALLGAVSAGVWEPVSAGVNHFQQNQTAKLYRDNIDELIDEGMISEEGTDSRRIAEELKAKRAEGKSISGSQIFKLIEANEAAINEENSSPKLAEKDTEKRLRDLSQKYGDYSESAYQAYKSAEGNSKDGQNIDDFFKAYDFAFEYGKLGRSREKSRNEFTEYLTDSQFERAYSTGRLAAGLSTETQTVQSSQLTKNGDKPSAISKQTTEIKSLSLQNSDIISKPGTLRSIAETEAAEYKVEGIKAPFSKKQRNAITVLRTLAEDTGINFVLFESPVTNGKRTGANGWYDSSSGTVYLDIFAGANNEQAILRTASHEITHFIKDKSPKLYSELKQFLTEYYQSTGKGTLSSLTALQIDKASKSGIKLDEVQAMDETIADACEMMLNDADAVKSLAKKHSRVFLKLKEWLDNFVNALKRAFDGILPNSEAAKLLSNSLESFTAAKKIWYDAFADSAKVNRGIKSLDTAQQNSNNIIKDGEINGTEQKASKDQGRGTTDRDVRIISRRSENTREETKQAGTDDRGRSTESQGVKEPTGRNPETKSEQSSVNSTKKSRDICGELSRFGSKFKMLDVYIREDENGKTVEIKDFKALTSSDGTIIVKNNIDDNASETFENLSHHELIHQWKHSYPKLYEKIVYAVQDSGLNLFDGADIWNNFCNVYGFQKELFSLENPYRLYGEIAAQIWGWHCQDPQIAKDNFSPLLNDYDGVIASLEQAWAEFEKTAVRHTGGTIKENSSVLWGADGKTYTHDNNAIEFTYAIVPSSLLITSNDINGNVNKNYPAALQPRDRTRSASIQQIQSIAQNLNPALLAESYTAQNGAPIIGTDGVVEGGNGRVNAIIYAFEHNTKAAKEYVKYIKDRAADFGIKDASSLPENPVLVRVNKNTDARITAASDMNRSTVAAYSASETAVSDAARVSELLGLFIPDETGKINTKENKPFISSFVESLPKNEQPAMLTREGYLSKQGLDRMKAAIFNAAYNDETLTSMFSEELDNDIKNITNALMNTAPMALDIRNGINNRTYFDINVVKTVTDAAKLYQSLKQSGTTAAQYEAQTSLQPESAEVIAIARFFEDNKRSSKAIAEFLNTTYSIVEGFGSPDQISLSENGFEPPSETEVIIAAFNRIAGSVEYELRDTEETSDRILLAQALESAAINDTEKSWLAGYKKHAREYDAINNQLNKLNEEIRKNKQEQHMDKDLAVRNEAKRDILQSKLARADKKLLRLEHSKPLARLLEAEKAAALKKLRQQKNQRIAAIIQNKNDRLAEERQLRIAKIKDYRLIRNESDAVKKYKTAVSKSAVELTKWLTEPTNEKHIPKVLKDSVAQFLLSIDLSSESRLRGKQDTNSDKQFLKNLENIKKAVKGMLDSQNPNSDDAGAAGIYSGYLDLPTGFVNDIESFTERINKFIDTSKEGYIINRMNSVQLKQLSIILKTLSKSIRQMNRFLANDVYKDVIEASEKTIEDIGKIKRKTTKSNVPDFFTWQNALPIYGFDRMGAGGKAVFNGFQKGMAKEAFNAKEILDFAEKNYTKDEVRQWSKEIRKVTIDGKNIEMPVSHIMSLYCLAKRGQARGHLLGGGFRIDGIDKDLKLAPHEGSILTEAELSEITDTLSDRQKKVADKLQDFMSQTGRKWGNEVHMRRFGYDLFDGEPNYFPIKSDNSHLSPTAADKSLGSDLNRLLNISPTKQTIKNANNRIMLYSIFDVFSDHMSDMAQYNAFALPVLDALKWLGYKASEKLEGGQLQTRSVQDALRNAFGDSAVGFVKRLLADINSSKVSGRSEEQFASGALRTYNRAQVSANLRVALLQPLSIFRASLVINPKFLLGSALSTFPKLKDTIAEMKTYSGIAAWKEMGFYDVNISRGLKDMIMGNQSVIDGITEATMEPAAFADRITWAAMWNAAKAEVLASSKNTNGKDLSKELYSKIAERFEEIVYRTQVVDSVLTKSQYMRSDGFFARMTSSFMSESTASYNMLASVANGLSDDIHSGMSMSQAWKKHSKRIARAMSVFAVSQTISAIVESVIDALRDDDDYETFIEKFIDKFGENLLENLNPLNLLPIVKDIWDAAKGVLSVLGFEVNSYGTSRSDMQMFEYFTSLIKMFVSYQEAKAAGKETNITAFGLTYKLLQFVSAASGLPAATTLRGAATLWNSTVGSFAPSLKLQTYKDSKNKGIDALYKAIADGDEKRQTELSEELFRHNISIEDVQERMCTLIRDDYLNNTIDDKTAIDRLIELGGYNSYSKDENDAYFKIDEWRFNQQNNDPDIHYSKYLRLKDSIANSDTSEIYEALKELKAHGVDDDTLKSAVNSAIKEAFHDKQIDYASAVRFLMAYNKYKSADAIERVKSWTIKNNIEYSYKNGQLDYNSAISALISSSGYSLSDADRLIQKWNDEKKAAK